MIDKTTLLNLKRRLLRTNGTRRLDPDKAGLSVSEYDMLCKSCDSLQERRAAKAKNSRTLILK